MKTIRVFWWKDGPREGNFGDELGPALVRILARTRVEWAPLKSADIISIGSVLEPWFWQGESTDFKGFIWGSGRMKGEIPFTLPADHVRLVRGPKSIQAINGLEHLNIPVGDPGLMAEIFQRTSVKEYSLGLVPHWSQMESPLWRNLAEQGRHVTVIDPCSGYENVINAIAQCDTIAATSLHGLIVADALGVPNLWVTLGFEEATPDSDNQFKFHDYFESVGRLYTAPVTVTGATRAYELSRAACRSKVQDTSQVKKHIMDAFPFY